MKKRTFIDPSVDINAYNKTSKQPDVHAISLIPPTVIDGEFPLTFSVDWDIDLLTSKTFTCWKEIANYKVNILSSLPGYLKLGVIFKPWGELGTIEIKKELKGCMIVFSRVTLVENYEELLEQANVEVNQMDCSQEEKLQRLAQKVSFNISADFANAKQKFWKETVDMYKGMLLDLSENASITKSPDPTTQITNNTVIIQGDNNGNLIVGDSNDLNITN